MYRVSTYRLSADARRVMPNSDEEKDRGQLEPKELAALLEAFLEIDPGDNEEFDPHVAAAGRAEKLIVRTSRGKLQVYDVHDHAAPAVEMTPDAIIARLDKVETTSPFPEEGQLPNPTAPHRGIAFAMLTLGLILNGYILYSVFYVESVNKKVEVKLLTDADEVKTKEAALAGVYATGPKVGDRVIEVDHEGGIRFYEIGTKGAINDSRDTYRIGRHDGLLCLTTVDSGVVDMVGENLVYYRDVYLRRKPSAP